MVRPLEAEFSIELGFSFNTRLGRNLIIWRNAVMNQDIDCCVVIDGVEGSGKSVFAQQVACFLDKDRKIDLEKQIHFDASAVDAAIQELPAFKAIIWDEAGDGMDRRESTTKTNIAFNKMLKKARQFNQFLILVLPSFYDMDQYPAIWRTRMLLHVFYKWDLENKKEPLKRGFFRLYNEDGKILLYTNKLYRQQYRYPHLKNVAFDATFPHHYLVDPEAYKMKKKVAEEERRKKEKGSKPSCGSCGSEDTRFSRPKKAWYCRMCDWMQEKESSLRGNTNNTDEGKYKK